MRPPVTRPRRVLLTTDTVGGVWTYTLDLARLLTADDVEVELVVLGPPPSLAQQHQTAALDGLRLTTVDLPLDWTAVSQAELREASRTFFALCRSMAPDIVHLNSPGLASEAVSAVPLVIGLHSCVASWWRAVYPATELPDDLAWRTVEVRRGLAQADAVIAPSAAFAESARAIYGAGCPIEAIHNGRDRPALPTAAQRDTIFTAGRLWDEAKNVATIDRAAALLPVPIHAAGPVRQPHSAQVFGCDHLELIGEVSSDVVREWLARTDIFVSSALYEPFGLGVLEAAQAGCALVLSDIPTFRELWHDAAIFVAPLDAAGFAAAIEMLRADRPERDRLADKARLRSEPYGLEAMAESTLGLYGRLIEQTLESTGEVA